MKFGKAYPTTAVQRFHRGNISRLGGIAMLLGFSVALIYAILPQWAGSSPNVELTGREVGLYLGSIIFSVLIGAWEDNTHQVSVMIRLSATVVCAALAAWALDLHIDRLGLLWLNNWLSAYPLAAAALAIFSIAGLTHAFNIIDGYNGLAGSVTVVISAALAYMALKVGDRQLAAIAICVVATTLGFLVWNYPRGMLFAGDGGAYFWGMNLGILSVLLIQRHSVISPWFVALLLIYPVWETVFSIIRKTLNGVSPGMADSLHLHHMVYRRIVKKVLDEDEAKRLLSRNNRTTPYLVGFTMLTVLPALIFWNNTPALMFFCMIFIVSYVAVYVALFNPKLVRWVRKQLR